MGDVLDSVGTLTFEHLKQPTMLCNLELLPVSAIFSMWIHYIFEGFFIIACRRSVL